MITLREGPNVVLIILQAGNAFRLDKKNATFWGFAESGCLEYTARPKFILDK